MRDIDNLKKIAVLIDADNAQMSKLKLVMDEISSHGHIITKRAYGDWANPTLKNWSKTLNDLAIRPEQQFAYTKGKNATDSAMIIDAMDLLYTDKYDAFALVSSDSDFTRLAVRLKESEIFVFGVGESKTPSSFRNACDDFILTENLEEVIKPLAKIKQKVVKKNENTAKPGTGEYDEVIQFLLMAHEKYEEEDGWCNVSSAGAYIKRVKTDFDVRTYKVRKLPELIERLSDVFEVTKFAGKGTVKIIAYRPLKLEKK
jgi:uncharacterized LabA/DUF88 family protein